MNQIKAGDRINNYIVEHLLGTGTFGQVWKARHHVFDKLVAIKVPTDPQYVHNLRREGVAIHGLHHENIVRALDLDPYASPPYLIIEFVDGPSLRQALDDRRDGLPKAPAIQIMRGLLAALSAAHRTGVIHRDIKPANILLNANPLDIDKIIPGQVKVTDFGLGTVGGLTTASIMQSGGGGSSSGNKISGTLAYMSPEQRDGKDVDLRSDLYSCGVVLFEMLTGHRPQGGDLPSSVRPGLDRYLDDVFRRCYTRLENRYQSADEMLADLSSGDAPPAEPAQTLPHFGRGGSASVCKNCGAGVSQEDQFCIHCGNQLVEHVPRCPSCEAYALSTDNYCIICGSDLRVQT